MTPYEYFAIWALLIFGAVIDLSFFDRRSSWQKRKLKRSLKKTER